MNGMVFLSSFRLTKFKVDNSLNRVLPKAKLDASQTILKGYSGFGIAKVEAWRRLSFTARNALVRMLTSAPICVLLKKIS